jgi:hypothetical protein
MAFKVGDVLPDPVLTRLAVELGTGGPYIADLIAPVARVQADSYKIATFGREDIKRDVKATRAPGSPAARVEFSKTYAAATVKYRSLKSDIPDEVRSNDPNGDTLDARRVKVLTNKLRLEVEAGLAALLAAATKTQAAPSTKWDGSSPKIRKDVLDARETFRKNAGMYPNVMVVPPVVKTAMFSDTAILDLIRYTQANFIATGQIPVFENMQIVVPGAIVDTSNPGAAASIADVWSTDEVYYVYVDQSAGDDIAAMTALRQVRSMATGGQAYAAMRWRDPDSSAKTDWVSVEVNQNEHVLAQELILRHMDILT